MNIGYWYRSSDLQWGIGISGTLVLPPIHTHPSPSVISCILTPTCNPSMILETSLLRGHMWIITTKLGDLHKFRINPIM